MPTLETCDFDTVRDFGQVLFHKYRDVALSFESAARMIAQEIYSAFCDDTGAAALVLVRVYRLTAYDDLLPGLQTQVDDPRQYYLALMGSTGDEAAWNDRRDSVAHQVIPARTASPMFRAMFAQLGLPWGAPVETESPLTYEQGWMLRSFFVPRALGSPLIPDQTQFVAPYGIGSVLGLGTTFSATAGCVLLAFARVELEEVSAVRFAELSPYAMTLLAGCDERGPIWD